VEGYEQEKKEKRKNAVIVQPNNARLPRCQGELKNTGWGNTDKATEQQTEENRGMERTMGLGG